MRPARLLALGLPLAALTRAAAAQPAADSAALADATLAWERGEYPLALRTAARLLQGAPSDRVRRALARLTGEPYHTDSIAADGRALRLSADGRWAAWESGAGAGVTTTLARVDDAGVRAVATVAGGSLALGRDRAAFLRVAETEELRAARADSARAAAAADREGVRATAQRIAALAGRLARVVVRDLASGAEAEALVDDALVKRTLAFSADGGTLYLIGWRAAGGDTALHALRGEAGGAPARVAKVSGTELTVVPGGRWLLVAPAAAGGFGAAARAASFTLVDTEGRAVRQVRGAQPAVSADGSALAFLVRPEAGAAGGGPRDFSAWLLPLGADAATREPALVKRTTDSLETPVPSPDGRRVAFASMPRQDWELAVVNADGTGEARLSREIQHDRVPRWVSATTLLAAKGEPRHRRSYLYDAATGQATKLFHNNTVRTIAPEYEWAATPDGSRVLIVAERDGDTVSPERGVYAVDLRREVTVAELRERVRGQLAAEESLRARGRAAFAPVRALAKRAADSVSIERLYGYQKALFDFGSKHITQPGNAPARQFLLETYKSFGYEPAFQEFTPRVAGNASVPPTANVVATLRGTENPELVYVVGSHFDSRAEGPGADDNTSGTAMLLETARVLAKTPLPATVVFVSFTGEEGGLLGSREFVRRALAEKWKVVGALNNDMMGWSNDQRLDNTIRYSNPGIRDAQHAAALEFSKLITYDALYYKSTDAAAFYDGWGDIVGGIGSYPVLGNPHYHMPHDVLETINQELVTETTRTNVATVVLLASSPSRLAGLTVARREGSAAELRWTPSPEKGVRAYRVAYGPASDPLRTVVTVTSPTARLANAPAGTVVSVKAVNARGLEGWDWARTVVR
jgi:hypothetical protein